MILLKVEAATKENAGPLQAGRLDGYFYVRASRRLPYLLSNMVDG